MTIKHDDKHADKHDEKHDDAHKHAVKDLPPPAAPPRAVAPSVLLEDGAELDCDVDHGQRTFVHDGQTYEHVATHASGRWIYRAM